MGRLTLDRDAAGVAKCAEVLGVPGLCGGLSVVYSPSSEDAKRTDDGRAADRPLPLAVEISGESIIDSTDAIDALRRGPASGDGPCTSRPLVGTELGKYSRD